MSDTPASGPQPRFEIQKLYLKDLSLECPNSPSIFRGEQWQPQANLQMASQSNALDDKAFEIVLTVTVTVTSAGKTAYLAEVQQAGIFTIEHIPQDQVGPLLGIGCPNILFPFAREVVADLVQKAGFPQHLLPPVNFEAIYAQQLRQRQVARSAGAEASPGELAQPEDDERTRH
jgi:preprotein translocase subunit SecB